MTTAAQRLAELSGLSGVSAATHLLAIGAGATAGALLASSSGLGSATARQHLLRDLGVVHDPVPSRPIRVQLANKRRFGKVWATNEFARIGWPPVRDR